MTDTSLFSLQGKVALVTGANTGLGQGLAVGLARAGAKIALVGRSSSAQTQEMIKAVGGESIAIDADLGTLEPIGSIISETLAVFGRIDILVNNAGIIKRNDSIDFTEEDWDAVMDVNLKSAFFLCQAVAKVMLGQASAEGACKGKIINIASMLSFQGGIRVPSYTASKSGLAGITKLLACEWAAKGINVNAIAPGYMVTNNTEQLRADPDRSRDILARIPAGRWGTPDDLAGAAVFLASSAADYMHGTIIPVDGGWLAR